MNWKFDFSPVTSAAFRRRELVVRVAQSVQDHKEGEGEHTHNGRRGGERAFGAN